jgi:hypothetical protein
MPNVYVKNSGSWSAAKEVFVKSGGSWLPSKAIYVKSGGSWVQVFPESTGTATFTSGSGTFTVPNGIYSLTVSYPTTSTATVTTTISVTPGQAISYNIGGFGATSTFGSVTAPIYDKQISTFSGNVDQSPGLYSTWGVSTSGGNTYSGSGYSSDLYDGAAAAGCYYYEFNEGGHGDLYATISITTALSATIQNSVQVYLSAFSGRGYYVITEQPSSGNSYRATVALYDPDRSEGGYSYTMNLQQAVPITVSW